MRMFMDAIKRETAKILRDNVAVIYVLIFPILGLLAYGFLFSSRVGRDYPVAVVETDGDMGTRMVRHYIESCPELDVITAVRTEAEAMDLMADGRIAAAVVMPNSMESDLKHRLPIKIDVLVDARNIVSANFILTAMQKAMGYGQAGVKFLVYKKLVPAAQARKMIQPVRFHSHPLGNPSVDYSFFIFTGILVMILQQCVLVGSAVGITGEKEQGGLAGTVAASGGALGFLFRRQLVYTVYEIPIVLAVLAGYVWIFRMPLNNALPLILFLVLFAQTVICCSQALAMIFRSKQVLLQTAVFFSMPTFFLGGYTWPIEDMSLPARLLSSILPTTPILNSWTTLTVIPGSLRWLGGAYLHQFVLTLVYFGLSWLGLSVYLRRQAKVGHGMMRASDASRPGSGIPA